MLHTFWKVFARQRLGIGGRLVVARVDRSVMSRVARVAVCVFVGTYGCGARTSLEVPGGVAPPPEACSGGTGPGLTDCGSTRESCCASLEVQGGAFFRAYTNDGTGAQGESLPATVAAFRLDKYMVTVGRFRRFVSAWKAGYVPSGGSGKHAYLNEGDGLANSGAGGGFESGWLPSDDRQVAPTGANLACDPFEDPAVATWTDVPGAEEALPINCVNWFEAYAFCAWDGGFLPSWAEWEYAGAGGAEQREYPWGAADPGTFNAYAIYGFFGGNPDEIDCYYPSAGVCSGHASIAPVGTASAGAGRWGQLDLEGELFEWVLDASCTRSVPCTNCACGRAEPPGTSRVFEGSAYYDRAPVLHSWRYGAVPPSSRAIDIGFRCARAP